MAIDAAKHKLTSIRHARATFVVSETCYRYARRLSDESAEIADWLVMLTTTYQSWGFGLCSLHFR